MATMSNNARVGKALELLRDGLAPKCEEVWKGYYGGGWLKTIARTQHTPTRDPSTRDISFLLGAIKGTWNEVFTHHGFPPAVRSLVFEVATARNRWAHQEQLSSDDARRALDSMERLLEAFGNTQEQQAIRALRRDLQRSVYEQEARDELRKKASRATEGKPQEGLKPWREIIDPHEDVRSGRFNQAEFVADLFEVAAGRGEEEYGDPRAFFARTYLTEGLEDLLRSAAQRLSSRGGEPVIELQTNFGGGKTHSMIALYHLTSGVATSELAGVGELLAKENLILPPQISRAVLVGHKIMPASAAERSITDEPLPEGIRLHTLWGHLAWQLGGAEGYELLRAADESSTNPGDTLRTLFNKFGPAVVLIDEWVAYARQLPEGGAGTTRPAGGDFDTQFTFAQALTEAAASVPNVVVLVTVPASDIEVGEQRGREALERLKNVIRRTAKQWQAASPKESFEIVRRRLFDSVPAEKARQRSAVIRAFSNWYSERAADFPSEAKEADYRNRLEACYPIHPELFDRLFKDWSALDKFQRTRGVLRLLALAISELWQRDDKSLLIMPGNLPMDWGVLVSEMKKYLEDGWDPVIKTDIDGENSLPLRLDKDNKHFGRYSAVRRVARTVYMGSAPGAGGTGGDARGLDIKRVVLGCVQPGEPPSQFTDAISRLSSDATYLYVDGGSYWYSLKPNVTRLARDRAEGYRNADVDVEIRDRILAQSGRGKTGNLSAVQVFAEGPGDVPDDADGVRLVVLTPEVTHSIGDSNSPARDLAEQILNQRDAGPRLNRNMLLFLAATANRLGELRASVRSYLAWKSVVGEAEIETLNLTTQQHRQAKTRLKESEDQVEKQIGETFCLLLTPMGKAGSSDIEWQTVRLSPSKEKVSLPAHVSKKLVSEEKLIPSYSGVRIRMDLDRFNLWSERGDALVKSLWEAYARFPYMPRLASLEVLVEAVAEAPADLAWETETFAYAEGFSEETDRWVGVSKGQRVKEASVGGYVVRGDALPQELPPPDPEASPSDPPPASGNGVPVAPVSPTDERGKPRKRQPTSYYALFDLDAVRGVKQMGDILEHIVNHLGENVELTLEIRKKNLAGFDDSSVRTASENAQNLGAKTYAFEYGEDLD